MKEAVVRFIRNARRVIVITHVSPDGDAIGSILGLGWALRWMGKEYTLACADPVPKRFTYLPGSEAIVTGPEPVLSPAEVNEYDLVISLDCGDLERLGAAYEESLADLPLINIDHHVTNTHFGTVNWIDTGAASAAEMVLGLAENLRVPLDSDIALCLLNGIVTDTRGFRIPHTPLRTMRAVLKLMEAGAELPEVTDHVFNRRPFSDIRLWARALNGLQLDGRIIWSQITQAMRRECAFSEKGDAGLVNFLGTTAEADVAIVFIEEDDGRIKVEMRAVPGVDVSAVALPLGGGGHPQAAGCTLDSDLDDVREKVLTAVKETLSKSKAQSSKFVETCDL
ncbi:MAG: bifunctional oligoribonuclease/PAP phosphatase NrnA [Anaerolineae bacterium]|nr:bifunctional oligoribonuclease/PAP phosphatase NrnA [Anaerolineae bacterium]